MIGDEGLKMVSFGNKNTGTATKGQILGGNCLIICEIDESE